MYAKEVTYEDYFGKTRKETFMFNLNEAEIVEMEYSEKGGLLAKIKRAAEADDKPELIKIFKDLVLRSYGVIDTDGRRFMKNDDIRRSFEENPAYSKIFMELATDDAAAAEFINNVAPVEKDNGTGTAAPPQVIAGKA